MPIYVMTPTVVETDLYIRYYTRYRETAPIHMSDLQCLGNESRLIDCPHRSGGSGNGVTLNCQKSGKLTSVIVAIIMLSMCS